MPLTTLVFQSQAPITSYSQHRPTSGISTQTSKQSALPSQHHARSLFLQSTQQDVRNSSDDDLPGHNLLQLTSGERSDISFEVKISSVQVTMLADTDVVGHPSGQTDVSTTLAPVSPSYIAKSIYLRFISPTRLTRRISSNN